MAEKLNGNEPSVALADNLFYIIEGQNVQRANTFIPTEDYSLEFVVVTVSEHFTDTCINITAEILAVDGSRKPTGSALASKTLLQESIPDDPAEITFTFDTPIDVLGGTEYVILLRSDAGNATTTARWWWGFTNTGVQWSTSDGRDTWTGGSTIPGFWFQIWGTTGSVFTPPSTNLTSLKRLVAAADNKIYFET